MAVAAERAQVVPVVERFIDDCETPVSAFLKLRAAFGGPAYLLESAEQGRLGRYSFLGLKPDRTLRWSLGDPGDPYEVAAALVEGYAVAVPEGMPPFPGGAVGFFGYDLVRTVERLAEPNPDPLGLPDMALMVCELMLVFDHLKHELSVIAFPFAEGADPQALIAEARAALRAPVPAPQARQPRGRAVRVQPRAGAVRGERGEDRRVRPRRGRLPGGALAALLGARSRPTRSRSTAACERSTPPRTCTSSTSRTSRSPAPRRSR